MWRVAIEVVGVVRWTQKSAIVSCCGGGGGSSGCGNIKLGKDINYEG
jgi:hypothetical protein